MLSVQRCGSYVRSLVMKICNYVHLMVTYSRNHSVHTMQTL